MLFATTVLCDDAQKSTENLRHLANPVRYLYFCINLVSPSIYTSGYKHLPWRNMSAAFINNEHFSWRQSPTRGSKLKTSKTEEKKNTQWTNMLCQVGSQASCLPCTPPATVNHLISLQLLLLHILQYVTPLLTGTWWLLIKEAWEIKLKKRGSG